MSTRIHQLATTALVVCSTAIAFAIGGARGAIHIDSGVAAANPRSGSPANIVADRFSLALLAQGTDPLENPSGVITTYGSLSNGTKTEPDENTYVMMDHNPGGPSLGFDYGRHFLFQGHENGVPNAYLTRINLDVPRADRRRITLLTPVNPATNTTGFGSIDGSVWNPYTEDAALYTRARGRGRDRSHARLAAAGSHPRVGVGQRGV